MIHLLGAGNGITVKNSAFNEFLPRKHETIDFDPLIEIWDMYDEIFWDNNYTDREHQLETLEDFKRCLWEVTSIQHIYDHNIGCKAILMELAPFVIEGGVKCYVLKANIQ